MKTAFFAWGFNDIRDGKGRWRAFAWDANAWAYERGRAFAFIYPGYYKDKHGEVKPDAVQAFARAFDNKVII